MSVELVDRFVDAYRRHDVDAVKALLLEDVEAEVFPSGVGWGREYHAEKGWLHGCFYHHIQKREQERDPFPNRLEAATVLGERVVLVFRDYGKGEALEEVWMFEESEAGIARIRDYCFSPDLVHWVAEHQGIPFRPVAYRFREGIYPDLQESSDPK